MMNHNARLLAAISDLVNELLGDDETLVAFTTLETLADQQKVHVSFVVKLVKEQGLTVGKREIEKAVRGFNSNSHDRHFGPGSCNSHGGSGNEQVMGFAGRRG